MAERDSAPELRTYGLRAFLLDQYDRVMGVETGIQLALARPHLRRWSGPVRRTVATHHGSPRFPS